jgi:regulator of RNase E activity RraA
MTNTTKDLGSTRDSEYMAVTEVLALADDAMTANPPEALLVISLSGKAETAIVGGALTAEAVE